MAFGMEGPIGDHWGLAWRKVSHLLGFSPCHQVECYVIRAGISITFKRFFGVVKWTMICV